MLKRTIVGLVLIPFLLLIVLAFPKFLVSLIAGVFSALAAYELLGATKLVRNGRMLVYTMAAAFFVSVWSGLGCSGPVGVLGLVVFYGALFFELMISDLKIPFSRLALCMMGGVVVPVMLNSLVRILMMEQGRVYILIPFVLAFMSDVGAYFVGSFFGKHKLCPTISPKKTVEGLIGGVAAAILGMLIFCLVMQFCFSYKVNYLLVFVYGIVGSLAGVFGDLSFSVVKRQTGIKDYGNIFPGHGGVLDRLDSVIVVAPIVEALLLWIPVVTG